MKLTKVTRNHHIVQRLFIVVVLAVSTALRLIDLGQSLWLDEAIEWWAVKTFSLRQLLFGYMTGDFNPPAHHLLMWFWIRFFGDSEKILRIPSVLFGVGIIWFTYKITSTLAKKEEKEVNNWPFLVCGISAVLAASSGLLVYYSQEARMYSMATFFVTSSIYFFLKHRQNPSHLRFVIYCLVFTAALYTHYLTWFLLPVFVFYGIQYVFPLLFTIPWWPELLKQFQAGLSTARNPVWAGLGQVTPKQIGLIFVKFVTGRVPFPTSALFVVPTIVAVVLFWTMVWIGAQHLWKQKDANSRLIVLWMFIPLAIGISVGFIIPIFSYFRFLFILPAAIVLASFGLARKRDFLEPIVVFFLLCTVIYISGPIYNREDWKGLVKELHSHEMSSVVLMYPAVRPPFDYYDRNASIVMDASALVANGETVSTPSVWYISYAGDIFGTKKTVGSVLMTNGYSRTFIRHFRGVTLEHWIISKMPQGKL